MIQAIKIYAVNVSKRKVDQINKVIYLAGVAGAVGAMLACTIEDIRKKQIHFWHAGIFIISNIIIACCEKKDGFSMLAGLLIGIVFFGISLCTREKIGKGDAFLIMGMGIFLGFYNTLFVVFIALLLVSVYGTGLVLIRKRCKWSYEVAFMPFLLVPYIGSIAFQIYEKGFL